jgi:cytochrome P450
MALIRAMASPDPAAPLAVLERIAAEHPRIAHTRVGLEHVYVLGDPDLIRSVFVTQGRSTMKGRAVQATRQLLGDGLLTSEGDKHRRHRRLIQPAFHATRLASYAASMAAMAESRADRWTPGATVDMAAEMSALTLTIVGRALFGEELSSEAAMVAEALDGSLTAFRRAVLPGGNAFLKLPLPSTRRAVAANERLESLVRRLIADRRTRAEGDDLLGWLVATRADATVLSDDEVRDEVMTLLLAGHETTASALSWTWLQLSRHPEAAAAVHAEVDRVLGGRRPAYDDVARLPVTHATIAEAMRLYPPAWVMGRKVTEDVEVGGWLLPRGATVLACQWTLHRDRRWWGADAARFRPSRWLAGDGLYDESAPGQPRGAYIPFGLGSRVCVGEGFAWCEAVLVLATLARRWSAALAPGVSEVPPRAAVTLRPAKGLPMVVHPR